MSSRKVLAIAAILMFVVRGATAQVMLEHKLTEGSTYLTDTVANYSQKLTIAGTEIETSNETTATSRATVGKRDGEGKIRVTQKIESLRATVDVMGQNYSFDSTNPDEKGSSPLEIYRPLHKAVAERTCTIVHDKSNRAVAVEYDQDPLASLPPEVRDIARSQLDPEQLKNDANEDLDRVKSDGVRPGDTWQRVKAFNFGSGQVMDFKTEYTYQSTIERDSKTLDKITLKVLDVTYALVNSTLPFTLKASNLKAAESDGTLLFDRQLGRATSVTSTTRVTGDITFVINGNDLPATIDLKIKSESIEKK